MILMIIQDTGLRKKFWILG